MNSCHWLQVVAFASRRSLSGIHFLLGTPSTVARTALFAKNTDSEQLSVAG